MRGDNALGVFDSGFGGLSLVKEIYKQLPNEEIIYLADTARCPYGVRPLTEVRQLVFEITEFLERKGVKMIVIACNTATAAGLDAARDRYPIPIVGVIQPGSESAVTASRNGRIGVIATEGTIKSRAYQRVIRTLNPNTLVFGRGCQGFVDLVERGSTKGEEVEAEAVKCLKTLLKEGIDTLVLGCTHFHFLEEVIRKVVGESMTIVDPASQTVEHIKDVLESNRLSRIKSEPPIHHFLTTGEIEIFREIGENLLGESILNLRHVELHEIIHAWEE